MSTAIPTGLQGVWTRTTLILDGVPTEDDTECVWAQGLRRFTDVRVSPTRSAGATVFAGTTVCTPDTLTWHHDLSIGLDASHPGETFNDTATFELDGDRLTERGTLDIDSTTLRYEEHWKRVSDPGHTPATWIIESNGKAFALAVAIGTWMVVAHGADGHGGGWTLRRHPEVGSTGRWTVLFGTSPEAIPLPESDPPTEWPWKRLD